MQKVKQNLPFLTALPQTRYTWFTFSAYLPALCDALPSSSKNFWRIPRMVRVGGVVERFMFHSQDCVHVKL